MVNDVVSVKFHRESHSQYIGTKETTDIILRKYYSKLGERIEKLLNEEDNTQQIDEVAKRIVTNSREAAERYLTEAIAKRMCMMYTDFNGDWMKYDVTSFVNSVMNEHLRDNHKK